MTPVRPRARNRFCMSILLSFQGSGRVCNQDVREGRMSGRGILRIAWPAAALALALPAHAAPESIGGPGAATVVAAVHGWTAWSERPRGARDYALVVVSPSHHVISRPAVAHRRVPFDLDGGVDAAGRAVVTYSRCATEP